MTLVSQIITDAYREANIIPLGTEPTANQITEALARLNSLILTTVGTEAGDELTDINYGGDWDQREYTSDHIPDNTRVMAQLDAATELNLDPRPLDGQIVAVVDVDGNFATYNMTLNGNGRNIEGASTLVLSTNSTSGRWLYRADTGNWVKIEELEEADSMPFPAEFDDYFTLMLALRLNPRYGQVMAPDAIASLRRWKNALRNRYRRKELNMKTDPGLLGPDESFYYDDNFAVGRYSPW